MQELTLTPTGHSPSRETYREQVTHILEFAIDRYFSEQPDQQDTPKAITVSIVPTRDGKAQVSISEMSVV